MKAEFLSHLRSELSRIKNETTAFTNDRQVFGGDINTTYIVSSNEETFFVKVNDIAFTDMLQKESEGLHRLRAANTILKIPEPILHGTYKQQSYLLMEYLEKGAESKILWQQLATGLAQLHQSTNDSYGLEHNNYIGTIVQNNQPTASWSTFYACERIMPLMQRAYDQHKCTNKELQSAEQFCNKLPSLLPEEPPALLHGDLWSGNRMFTVNGKAAIYDPAVYYGHRETDIAMTLLFGGFDADFYNTYNEVFPLQQGWRERVTIYQLYPLLVHLVLFGGHYYNSVQSILKKHV